MTINILYAEDNIYDFELIKRYLHGRKIDVSMKLCMTFDEYSSLLETNSFDLVLADHSMIGLSIEKMLVTLEERDLFIPLIIISGQIGEEAVTDLLHNGAYDYVSKDNLSRLIPAINRAIHTSEADEKLRHIQHEHLIKSVLLENVNDGIISTDESNHILYSNKAAQKIFGFSDFKNQLISEFTKEIPENELNRLNYLFEKNVKIVRSIQNNEQYYELRSKKIYLDKKHVVIYSIKDISKRYTLYQQLNLKKIELESILNNPLISIWAIDTKYKLIMLNTYFKNEFKKAYQIDLTIGESIFDQVPKQMKMEWKTYYDRAFLGESFGIEKSFEFNDLTLYSKIFFHPIYSSQDKVYSVAVFSHDITKQKQLENNLKSSLQDRDILLNEMQYRVKNNIHLIASLLKMQKRHLNDTSAVQQLSKAYNRVVSLALIYENLQPDTDFSQIDFSRYLQNLTSQIYHSICPKDKHFTIQFDMEEVTLDIYTSIPLGLILNEMISNSIKHAFPNKKEGNITIRLKKTEKEMIFYYKDNGKSIENLEILQKSNSLGYLLIQNLSKQIRANLSVEITNGLAYKLSLLS